LRNFNLRFFFCLTKNKKVLLSTNERNNINHHNTFLSNNGMEDTIGSIPLISSRNNIHTAEKLLVEDFDNVDDLSQEKNYFNAKDNNNSSNS